MSLEGFDVESVVVGGETLTVAVAETQTQRNQGLRGVSALPDGIDGMLFAFGESRTATFGMRDALMTLDIWWFDSDGRLLGSAEMDPCTTDCAGYGSPGKVMWALETPAGELELVPGDELSVMPGP